MRILLIEDDHQIAENIAEYLRDYSFAVDVSYDGIEGFNFAKGITPYDIILLDRMLPGKDGSTICRELRASWIKTPIIMVTAMDTVDARVEWLDVWADDYLIKPFALKELLARINAQLRRNHDNMENGTKIQIEDLILDTKKKIAIRAGKEIQLSRKLYQLLELLMRNSGTVLSKSQIEEHVWERNADLWSDVVRSHIQILRTKIDKWFKTPLIKTVHGMWYTIENKN